ncbi:MAG: N-6 DNA methylase [Chloroflexi bacterium]|nr:N-6 DNA methylase [Chloroflexota bacterium]MCI0644325.1 N-6 DNA methylase [Chloroflexota bacterium]
MPTKADHSHLDDLFRDPKTKYKLDLFKPNERARLQLFEQDGKLRIRCLVRGRDFIAKPEEVVRQLVLNHLHYSLGYDISQMAVEVQVKMGSAYNKKAADIVVYREPHKITPYIIVEVKKPGRQDGREQLHSYMNATGAPFGMWTNGSTGLLGVSYELRTEPNLYAELPRLPAAGESLDDVLEPIRKKDLKPADDLIALVKQMQEEVLANAGVNVFEEVFKLFFVKLWDEERTADLPGDDRSVCQFRITADPPAQQYYRFKGLLDEACQEYPDIFSPGTNFDLSPEALMVAASVLERVRLTDTDLELVDLAFEYLMSPESKGDKGQYFTPRQVIRMAVKMLNPKMSESMLDPACGPCGFPVHTLLHVRDHELRHGYRDWEIRLQQYGQRHIFATDFDPRVVRVAKFIMRLAGDGRTNVYRMNSLDPREWPRDQQYQQHIAGRPFDIIMTNPPFAGTIRHPQILNTYDLAFTETRRLARTKDELRVIRERKGQSTQTRDVLFLDYCLNKLAPGGRLAIVLPQGHFNNISAEQTRRTLMSRARILAVVGLHGNAFKPHTGTKTSVLFLQKWAEPEASAWREWYEELYEHERQMAEYEALLHWRNQLLKQTPDPRRLPAQIRQEPPHPGPPPAPPGDYPIFFATSRRSGRDNSGNYDLLKDAAGNVVLRPKTVLVHDEDGQRVETEQMRQALNTDLDDIADAFLAWGREQGLDFLTGSPYDGRSFNEVVVGANLDVSSVSAHDLGDISRLDAEYYRPAYLKANYRIHQYPNVYLGNIAFITDGQHGYHEVDETSSIKHITAKCITNGRIDVSQAERLAESTHLNNLRSACEPDDVILTTAGTIGNAGIVTPDILPANMDQDVARIKVLGSEQLNPWYLMVFLNSFYGRFQTTRETTGQIQGHLSLVKVSTLQIPILTYPEQHEIARLAQSSIAILQESERLYQEAEQMLMNALGIPDLDLSDELYNLSTLSEVWNASRLDTDYFEKRYKTLLTHVKKFATKAIGEVALLRQERFVPQEKVAFEYIEISSINLSNGLCSSKQLWGEDPPDRAQQIVRKGDVITSTVRPIRGGTALIQSSQDGYVCSSGFAVLQPYAVSPEYLLTYLNLWC